MIVWRIARRGRAALDGEGSRLYGGRWTPRGAAAAYASSTLSLAALERFVHTDPDLEPNDLVSLRITIGPALGVEEVAAEDLPRDWRAYPAPPALAAIGRRWLGEARTAVLSVPSAIIPQERNVVLNPAHPDSAQWEVARPEPFSFDPRMWRRRR